MSANELKEIKKEIVKIIDNADERAVRMVYALLEAEQKNDLTAQQETLLQQRIEKYESGQMRFSNWSDVRRRITTQK